MSKKPKFFSAFLMLLVTAVVLVACMPSLPAMPLPDNEEAENAKKKNASDFAAVDNMHHFMEYINEPVFNELKAAINDGPPAKKNWGKIKSSSLILAETSILLADRTEFKDEQSWRSTSLQLHQTGKALYQAARKKNLESTKKHFAEMVQACTKCHEEYR